MEQHSSRRKRQQHDTRYTVHDDCTAEAFFNHIMPGKSRTSLKQLLAKNVFSHNGKPLKRLDTLLLQGDTLTQHARPLPHFDMPPTLRIVYEDPWIVVVDKAAGLLTMATDKQSTHTAYAYVAAYLKFYNPTDKVFIVHRLDRDTSGLIVFAKNEAVQQQLQSTWNTTVHCRRYAAVVEGVPREEEATIRTNIIENPKSLKMSVCGNDQGVEAVTHYRLVKHNDRYALLDVELQTGRKNQIRVHMQHIGHPIAGDVKYGARSNPAGRLCLHAYKLEFVHPQSQKTLIFDSPTPRELAGII